MLIGKLEIFCQTMQTTANYDIFHDFGGFFFDDWVMFYVLCYPFSPFINKYVYKNYDCIKLTDLCDR